MSIYSTIISSLATQDDQGNDWYAWASNQLSHILLGVVFSAPFFILNAKLSNTVGALVAIGILKKASDWYRETVRWRIIRDTIQDLLFFYLGLIINIVIMEKNIWGFAISFIFSAVLLLLGVFGRIPKKEQ